MERDPQRWTAEGIVQRDISSILSFLVDLSHFTPCPLAIPSNVTIAITHQDIIESGIKNKTTLHHISGDESQYNDKAGAVDINYYENGKETSNSNADEDVFDNMEENQDKIAEIKELLIDFCNKHLQQNVQVNDITDFSDGVYIIWLIGLIKNIFIPSYQYKEDPKSYTEKMDNINFGIFLLNNLGINCSKIKSSDVAKGDIKSILRCLYVLFSLVELDENPAS